MTTDRVLFITRNYPPRVGGMEAYSANLYQALSRHVPTDLHAHRRGKWMLPWFLVTTILLLVFRARRYTHIHFGDGVLAPLALMARWISRARISLTVHALDITYPNPLYQRVVPFCLARLDRVVCVSKYTRGQCTHRGIPDALCCVIPNGIDFTQLPDPSDAECNRVLESVAPPGKTMLLSVGRLIRRKGMAWFVDEVMPKLPEEYVLLIAGSGPEQAAVEQAIAARQLDGRVVLLGRAGDTLKTCLYRRADVFVMPNIEVPGDAEGFGISVIEAGAQGLPVVAVRLQGITDAVQEGITGTLVESGSAQAFTEAIRSIDLTREGVSIAVRQHYDWARLATDYLEALGIAAGESC